ncbi:MAG: rhomboid family intramembrane serine protease [Muribaculaceae bacterium]|nr:rhomboid family intramembrane serine protease [Muribaculaceae bacterium]
MATGLCDIRGRLSACNALWVLVAVNAVVWLASIVDVKLLHGSMVVALALPSAPQGLLVRPWSPLTYMFVQTDFFHLLFNMLWLVCFGRLLMLARGARTLLWTYVGGGVAGAVVFILAGMIFPAFGGGSLIGSSAAVLAVAVAAAFAVPDLELPLWLIGSVKVKWIVAVMCVLFCAGFTGPMTANSAHIGGAAYAALAAIWHKRGKCRPRKTDDEAAELDRLLDKVKRSGYDSLSRRDKERLFNLSHRVRR